MAAHTTRNYMVTNSGSCPFTHVDMVGITVRDQEAARDWYAEKLGFEVRQDNPMPGREGRWITVGVPGQPDFKVVLQPTSWGPGETEQAREDRIGTEMLTVHTDDLDATVETLRGRGVEFTHDPEEVPWGTYALFEDLYANEHQVLEPAAEVAVDRGADESDGADLPDGADAPDGADGSDGVAE